MKTFYFFLTCCCLFFHVSTAQVVLDRLNLQTDGTVNAIAVDEPNDKIYIGGNFTAVGGQARSNLASFDISTGAVNTWNPGADGAVNCLVLSGNILYAGGAFTTIAGQPRNRIATVDKNNATAGTWNPNANNLVNTIALSGSIVYAGGTFTTIGGQARNRIAALDAATALATSFNPNANDQVYTITPWFIPTEGDVVIAGGQFDDMGTTPTKELAVIRASDGMPLPTTFVNGISIQSGAVYSLVTYGTKLYAGGSFFLNQSGTVNDRNTLALWQAPAGFSSWDPGNQGNVRAIVLEGNVVYLGGTAVDATTGATTLWNPGTNNSIRALAVCKGVVYVGGNFSTFNGSPHQGLAGVSFLLQPQTITFSTIPTKTYGNSTFTLDATSTSGLPVTYTSSNASVATISGNVVTITGAGTSTIKALQGGDYYTLPATDAEQTLTVDKATLTVTADNKSRTYGSANPGFSVSYSGFVNGETLNVLNTQPTASTSATPSSNAGPYAIVPAGGADNNYAFAYINGSLTINKAALTVTAANKNRVYGSANPTFNVTYAGFVNGETATVLDTQPSASTTATTLSNVNTYSIVPSGGVDANYSFTYVNGTLTITKAVLSAMAENKSRAYGAANPAFTILYSGFVNNETSSVIDTKPTAATTATTSSNVSTYTITPSDGEDNNYTFTYTNGTLSITKAALTATAENKNRVFGVDNPTFTIAYSGLANGETAAVLDITPTASTVATIASNAGPYTIIASGGDDNNYSFTYVSGTLTIGKAPQVITFSELPTKTVGDAPFNLTATSNSGLTVTYASSNTAVASISGGNLVTINAPGTTNIKASQAGNINYLAAPDVTRTLSVKQNQTINFPVIADKTLGGNAFSLSATATSGLPVVFSSTSNTISVSGTTVTLAHAGKATVKAEQTGNTQFHAATPVEQTFCVNPPKPSIIILAENHAEGLTSSSSEGNQWFLNDVAIDGATSVNYEATESGAYRVQVTIDNCSSELSEPTTLVISAIEPNELANVKMYPNPVNTILNVETFSAEPFQFQVYHVSGKTEKLSSSWADGIYQIPVHNLSPGVYVLKCIANNKMRMMKFVKK